MPDTVPVPTIAIAIAIAIAIEAAHRVITTSEAGASEMGVPMCGAVVDAGGNLGPASPMDGAPLLSTHVTQ